VVAQDQDARFDGAIDDLDGTGLKGRVGELERGGSRHGNERGWRRMDSRVEEEP
jgi:hypothetical protein